MTLSNSTIYLLTWFFVTPFIVEAVDIDAVSKIQMDRKTFLTRLEVEGQKEFCSDSGILECFDVSVQKCRTFYKSMFASLANKDVHSKKFLIYYDDVELANSIGTRLGESFAKTFSGKFKRGPGCTLRN